MAFRQLAPCAVRCLGRVASEKLTATGGAPPVKAFLSHKDVATPFVEKPPQRVVWQGDDIDEEGC